METIKRIFSLILGTLAMVVVALLSAFIAMRLAIHGREVVVPALTGLPIADATRDAGREGLALTLENRFYSADIPAGRVLAQSPAPGARVRREAPIRITESLGGQRVAVPDLAGQSERAATLAIRRLGLDPGAVAHLPSPGEPGLVLTQTPPANAAGVESPRVSLLVSDPAAASPDSSAAYVMPSLIGLTYAAAAYRASTAGLHLVIADLSAAAVASTGPTASSLPRTTPIPPQPESFYVAPASPNGMVATQYPGPGHRVIRGEAVHVTLSSPSLPDPT